MSDFRGPQPWEVVRHVGYPAHTEEPFQSGRAQPSVGEGLKDGEALVLLRDGFLEEGVKAGSGPREEAVGQGWLAGNCLWGSSGF